MTPETGLERRYEVRRIGDTGKHDACRYFVLDPQHDPTAHVALAAYADATPNPALAADLRAWLTALDGTAP